MIDHIRKKPNPIKDGNGKSWGKMAEQPLKRGVWPFLFILLVLVTFSILINLHHTRNHAQEVAMSQAKTIFDYIVLTRRWNAQHYGVYAKVTKTTRPNPYLSVPERDVLSQKGTQLTMINPAYMTRQIGDLSNESENIQLHITSLSPINSKNSPTPWERVTMEGFKKGVREKGVFVNDEKIFRYIAPLITEKACLKCHQQQGNQLGDLRGAITVSIPADKIIHNRNHSIINILITHGIVFSICCLAYLIISRKQKQLIELKVEQASGRRADKSKGAFIANLSHGLRTPLNVIAGMEQMLDDKSMTPKQQEYLNKIRDASSQLKMLVNSMLDFFYLDAGRVEPSLKSTDLEHIIVEVVQGQKEKAKSKGLQLGVIIDEKIPKCFLADSERLNQVLTYLVDNSIKFTQTGGVTVELSAIAGKSDQYRVIITVEDSGIGMDPEAIRLINHNFVQLDQSSSKIYEGIGIGLTLSHHIINMMGGRLSIKSDAGKGTRVQIELPLQKAEDGGEKTVVEESKPTTNDGTSVTKTVTDQIELSQQEHAQLIVELDRLKRLMDSDYSQALTILSSMVAAFGQSKHSETLSSISQKVKKFETDEARKQCDSLLRKLKSELES